jgi:hypothetical protein
MNEHKKFFIPTELDNRKEKNYVILRESSNKEFTVRNKKDLDI